jgi:transcriptional regulator with XRE-family HTH domain
MTPGQYLHVMRELKELSQNELAELSGLPQSTISGMESGRINIGVERAKVLAKALRVHT